MVILSIADFHLTSQKSEAFENNLNGFMKFLNTFRKANYEWTPDFVCICGDIAGSGQEKEYGYAKSVIERIARAAGLSMGHVLMVPGNHDLNLEEIRIKYDDIDPKLISQYYNGIHNRTVEWLEKQPSAKNPAPQHVTDLFRNYAKFRKSCIPEEYKTCYKPLCRTALPEEMSHLCGYMLYDLDKIVFLELNSSWCDIKYIHDVRIGRMLIEELYQQVYKYKQMGYYIVAMFHHSLRFLNIDEYRSRTQLPVYDRIIELADLCISGHEHGAISKDPDFLGNTCQYILNAGFFSVDTHNNLMESGASIIRIDRHDRLLQMRKIQREHGSNIWSQTGIKTYSTKERLLEPKFSGIPTAASMHGMGLLAEASDHRVHERIAIDIFGQQYRITPATFEQTYILTPNEKPDQPQLPTYITFVDAPRTNPATYNLPECEPSQLHIVIMINGRDTASGRNVLQQLSSKYASKILHRKMFFVAI